MNYTDIINEIKNDINLDIHIKNKDGQIRILVARQLYGLDILKEDARNNEVRYVARKLLKEREPILEILRIPNIKYYLEAKPKLSWEERTALMLIRYNDPCVKDIIKE